MQASAFHHWPVQVVKPHYNSSVALYHKVRAQLQEYFVGSDQKVFSPHLKPVELLEKHNTYIGKKTSGNSKHLPCAPLTPVGKAAQWPQLTVTSEPNALSAASSNAISIFIKAPSSPSVPARLQLQGMQQTLR